ncbi:hypothetical protein PULV_b0815 [Pseudoalteromonas ulvae UL12]|uniref:Uncharacterized protein n=1 Tax=Pseudoalteromonas ulvae TaxID=107327 RepID=A0A244CRG5_PSEDV|nr:type VI secretion lipoprotein TssJ [Pseudoalteromonas ulvae]MBE0366076.1 hypothetical protein [Pseudoalteromonas ulvae UL12]OUL58201.1 hypothetical protein B1199_07555 [Pseudoalteromonas ulvae]
MIIKLLSLQRLILLLLMIVSLTGCSSIPFFGDDAAAGNVSQTVAYADPTQKDHWLENAKAWRNWDINHPNNQLVEWVYNEAALIITLSASSELNSFNDLAHMTQIRVIQLSDITGLTTLLKTQDGVRTAMVEPLEMLPNAISIDTVNLAPNQTYTIELARQQDAKFIALVAGFAQSQPQQSVRIITIPVITISPPEVEKSWFDTLTFGLFSEDSEPEPDIIRPAKLKIDSKLGENEFEKFVAKAF